MCRNSQRILVEAAYSGVFRREESSLRRIPHSSLPVPKFAANVVPCSAPLKRPLTYIIFDSFSSNKGQGNRRSGRLVYLKKREESEADRPPPPPPVTCKSMSVNDGASTRYTQCDSLLIFFWDILAKLLLNLSSKTL